MERAQAAVAISNRALHQIILQGFTTESRCACSSAMVLLFNYCVWSLSTSGYKRGRSRLEVSTIIEGIPYGGTDFNDYTTGNRYSYTILIDRRNCRILDLIWFENFVNNKLRLDQELPICGLRRFGIHSFLDGGRINQVSIIR